MSCSLSHEAISETLVMVMCVCVRTSLSWVTHRQVKLRTQLSSSSFSNSSASGLVWWIISKHLSIAVVAQVWQVPYKSAVYEVRKLFTKLRGKFAVSQKERCRPSTVRFLFHFPVCGYVDFCYRKRRPVKNVEIWRKRHPKYECRCKGYTSSFLEFIRH